MTIQLLPGTAFDGVFVLGVVYHVDHEEGPDTDPISRRLILRGLGDVHVFAICFGFFMVEFTW